jgi:class 3 adenylate cyclase
VAVVVRSEELLYQMIPRKVAQQLKAGSKITAEQFEEVTVCFCDIVAFTKIAANSTPLQVQNMSIIGCV